MYSIGYALLSIHEMLQDDFGQASCFRAIRFRLTLSNLQWSKVSKVILNNDITFKRGSFKPISLAAPLDGKTRDSTSSR